MSAQLRKVLEYQANDIEAVLSLHKIPARVTGGTVAPRWIRFQVLPAVGAKISKIKGLSEELAAALNSPTVRVSRRGAAVAIEVPRDDPQPVRLLSLYRQLTEESQKSSVRGPKSLISPVTAILGLAEDGAPLLIRLPSPDVRHISIVGTSGAGKTTLLRAIILSLAMTNKPADLSFVFLADGLLETAQVVKQMGFATYRIEGIGMAVLRAGIGTVGKRVVVAADDVMASKCLSGTISQLARLMKDRRRHYIFAWSGVPLGEMVDLFPVRLAGRVTSVEDARTATGWSGTGAERLTGHGDFLAVAKGRVIRFQAAHVSPAEIQEVVAHNEAETGLS